MEFRDTETSVNDTVAEAPAAKAAPVDAAAKPAAKPRKRNDSKAVAPQAFDVEVDHSRDALLTEFGKETLRDRYLLPVQLEGLETLVPDLTLARVEHGGHFIPWQRPADVTGAMREWLASHPA